MLTCLDIETTFQKYTDRSDDPSPYNPDNYIVSIGWKSYEKDCQYYNIANKHYVCDFSRNDLVTVLKETSILVAHNIKFDLSWLYELGYEYNGELWDTMLYEYVNARGVKIPLDLTSCCVRRGLPGKLKDEVQEYLNKGIGFEEMPWNIVKEYGTKDIEQCYELALIQMKEVGYDFSSRK